MMPYWSEIFKAGAGCGRPPGRATFSPFPFAAG